MGDEALGVLMQSGNTVAKSEKYMGLFTMGVAQGNGRDVTPANLTRAAVTFSIRRAVQGVIAEQKLLWVRDKDIFTRPPESLLTPEFVADCMVYSLFDRQSNQTSLRGYEYQGRTSASSTTPCWNPTRICRSRRSRTGVGAVFQKVKL